MENGKFEDIDDNVEFGLWGLAMGLLTVQYILVAFCATTPSRSRAFNKEFMKQFNTEH